MIPLPSLSLRTWLSLAGGVALLAMAAWVWRIDHLRAAHLKALGQCTSEKSEQAQLFQRAQKSALDMANAAKARKEAENEAARQTAESRYDDLAGKYRAIVLRKAAADRRAASSARLPGAGQTAQGADRPGDRAGLSLGSFVISEADALTCADNTARLQAGHEWAIRDQPQDQAGAAR